MAFSPSPAAIVERRLGEIGGKQCAEATAPTPRRRRRSSAWGRAAPKSPSEMGKLRGGSSLPATASSEALRVFLGVRVGCALLTVRRAGAAAVRPAERDAGARRGGPRLPAADIVLARLARSAQHRIRLSLPDALDLLVVSVEAGLGLDQAMQRVGDELVVRASRAVRRAAADQLRASRRQGAHRGAAQPRRADRASTT